MGACVCKISVKNIDEETFGAKQTRHKLVFVFQLLYVVDATD